MPSYHKQVENYIKYRKGCFQTLETGSPGLLSMTKENEQDGHHDFPSLLPRGILWIMTQEGALKQSTPVLLK